MKNSKLVSGCVKVGNVLVPVSTQVLYDCVSPALARSQHLEARRVQTYTDIRDTLNPFNVDIYYIRTLTQAQFYIDLTVGFTKPTA